MSEIEVARREFQEELEKLKDIHAKDGSPEEGAKAHEKLREQQKKILAARDRLFEVSFEDKRQFETRMEEVRLRAEAMRAKVESQVPKIPRGFTPHLPPTFRMPDELRLEEIRKKIMKDEGWEGEIYECPLCGDTWSENHLNMYKTGRGKKAKKRPWCFKCNMEVYPRGSRKLERVKKLIKSHKIKVLK